MKKNYLKTVTSLLIGGVFLFLAFGSGDSKKSESKTEFQTREELWKHIQYDSYDDLKAEWGSGSVGTPWDASGVGKELDIEVSVYWENIKCEGSPIKITFQNNFTNVKDMLTPNPGKVISYNVKGDGAY